MLDFDVVFWGFLVVILIPELSRKVRETRGIHFHQFSSIYVLAEPSYDDLTDVDGQFGRKFDGQLSEKRVKTVQNNSLQLPPNTRTTQTNKN